MFSFSKGRYVHSGHSLIDAKSCARTDSTSKMPQSCLQRHKNNNALVCTARRSSERIGTSMKNGAHRPETGSDLRLDSWKQNATYLNRHMTTVRRWERQEGFASPSAPPFQIRFYLCVFERAGCVAVKTANSTIAPETTANCGNTSGTSR